MFYLISDDRTFLAKAKEETLKQGLFFYSIHEKPKKAIKTLADKSLSIAVIDARYDRQGADLLAKHIKELYEKATVIAVIDSLPGDMALYKQLSLSDFEIYFSHPKELAKRLLALSSRFGFFGASSYKKLQLIPNTNNALLLGFPLKLTKSERRIIDLLCLYPERPLDAETILNFCFAKSEQMSPKNVPTHIFNINRKATQISNRCLIINSRGAGYILNPNM